MSPFLITMIPFLITMGIIAFSVLVTLILDASMHDKHRLIGDWPVGELFRKAWHKVLERMVPIATFGHRVHLGGKTYWVYYDLAMEHPGEWDRYIVVHDGVHATGYNVTLDQAKRLAANGIPLKNAVPGGDLLRSQELPEAEGPCFRCGATGHRRNISHIGWRNVCDTCCFATNVRSLDVPADGRTGAFMTVRSDGTIGLALDAPARGEPANMPVVVPPEPTVVCTVCGSAYTYEHVANGEEFMFGCSTCGHHREAIRPLDAQDVLYEQAKVIADGLPPEVPVPVEHPLDALAGVQAQERAAGDDLDVALAEDGEGDFGTFP